MNRFQRYDFGSLAPAPAKRRDNGWLQVDGRSARVGILEYPQLDGTVRRELVLPEELFKTSSMESAHMVPLTNNHPKTLLDEATTRECQVGNVGQNLRGDGDYLVAPMLITDGETVRAVEAGKQQLSWGYSCEIGDADPALFEKYGRHDGIQRDRQYNHLAIVDAARAGSGAHVRLDAAGNAHLIANDDTSVVASPQPNPTPEIKPMPAQIVIGTLRLDATDANTPAIQAALEALVAQTRKDGEGSLAAEKARADMAAKELGVVKTKLDQVGATILKNWSRIRAKWDAMKTRAATCDECAGTKQVDGQACKFCDGTGTVLAHSAMKGEPVAEEMEKDAAALTADPDGDGDAPTAAPEKMDALRNDIATAAKKRADSVTRMVKRDTAARVALETSVRKYLGEDAKLDALSPEQIHRETLAKLDPGVKLDGKNAAAIKMLFDAALEREAAKTTPPVGAGGGRSDGAPPSKPAKDWSPAEKRKHPEAFAARRDSDKFGT